MTDTEILDFIEKHHPVIAQGAKGFIKVTLPGKCGLGGCRREISMVGIGLRAVIPEIDKELKSRKLRPLPKTLSIFRRETKEC